MLDIGWGEMLVIGVVALIVVGPKDLPVMFRTLGRYTGQLRRMAREFTSAMNDAADQSGARDVMRDLNRISSPRQMGVDALKKATGLDEAKAGPNTAALSAERAEAARKLHDQTAARPVPAPEPAPAAAPEPATSQTGSDKA